MAAECAGILGFLTIIAYSVRGGFMDKVLVVLASTLVALVTSILLLAVYFAQQQPEFPYYLKPEVTIEKSSEITLENYEHRLDCPPHVYGCDKAVQWLLEHLGRGSRVYYLELGIRIVNRSGKDTVTVYTSGCTGFMEVNKALEGNYFHIEKICTLPLITRDLEPRGGTLRDGERLLVTAPSRITAVFETDLAAFCRMNECYRIRFEFEISTNRDGESKITILRVEYIPTKPLS